MYLTLIMPDIIHVMSLINRYKKHPRDMDLLVAKRNFLYLQETIEHRFYKKSEKSNLFGFTNNNYTSDLDEKKSILDYVFMIGSATISCCSKK